MDNVELLDADGSQYARNRIETPPPPPQGLVGVIKRSSAYPLYNSWSRKRRTEVTEQQEASNTTFSSQDCKQMLALYLGQELGKHPTDLDTD